MKEIIIVSSVALLLMITLFYLTNKTMEHYVDLESQSILQKTSPVMITYDKLDFQGDKKVFRQSMDSSLLKKNNWNNRIKSISLSPFTRAILYEQEYYGESYEFENDQDTIKSINLPDEISAKISSFKLELIEPYIILYEFENLGGKSKIFRMNIPIIDSTDIQPNSMVISPYTNILLFDDRNYSGDMKSITNKTDKPYIVKYIGGDWHERLKSIKIAQMFDRKYSQKVDHNFNHPTEKSVMHLGECLLNGRMLVSDNDTYKLIMQNDGNLVLYKFNEPVWSTNTIGAESSPPYRVCLHEDGNLVVYGTIEGKETPRWQTNTGGKGVKSLIVHDDGTIILLGGQNEIVWKS